MEKESFGGRLKQARLNYAAARGREMSQSELARELGVAQSMVNRWERDIRTPDVETTNRIAAALNVSPAWLAWGGRFPAAPPAETPAEHRARVAADAKRKA